ncbi:glycosyltransferase [Sutcliffiella horikoshii]|uniref:Glycosyltransferase n=1 Tax=Sutcliffiella horikoshii TaxID=79883 RepID=A0AA94WQ84_9BACI|nr:glycosyltransferase [Sutcliffiella horikoshii]TYS60070.1 glycosyltransferase [Sutcliffiella horikoshii]
MNPKLSIIVPIFNVETYLERCFESLLNQRLEEIEILAVNDGSTDNSLVVLKEMASKDKRIVVLDKKNGGVSSARNFGISNAKGEYIGFVDPDDWVDEEMYVQMYANGKENNAEIVMCSYVREFGTHSKEKKFNLPSLTIYQKEEVKKEILRKLIGPVDEEVANPEMLDAWGTVWSKIYKTSLIRENIIKFTDLSLIGTNEDTLFNIQTCYYANKFLFLNKPYYHYWRQNTTSITTTYKQDLINKWFILFSMISDFINEKNLESQYTMALRNRIALNVLGLGLNEMSPGNTSGFTKKTMQIRKILHSELFNQSLHQLELQQLSLKWRVFYYFAKKKKSICLVFMLYSIEWLRKTIR